MSHYEDMIDLDINANVTALEYGCGDWEFNGVEFYHCGIDGSGYFSQPVIDYCNNPAESWPIMMKNKITVIDFFNEYIAVHDIQFNDNEHSDSVAEWVLEARHKNPLRAAMIVYLKMNDKD